MEKQQIISSGILESYVIGAASAEEVILVEQWRQEYAEVADELARIEMAMEAYAVSIAVQPSPGLKSRIFSAINKDGIPETAKVVKLFPVWKSVAAAALLLLAGSAVLNILFFNKYKNANNRFAQSQSELAVQNQKVNELSNDWKLVQNKYSQPVSLKGLEAAPGAAAKIFWMKNSGETYIDPSNLPEVPEGMQYQLWAIIDGKPVDAGMIVTDAGKKFKMQKMKTFGKVQAFAVTLETKGGHPEPKGKMYVMGEI